MAQLRVQMEIISQLEAQVYTRHGTGSLGHRVNGSFGSSFTSGSPGHHFDPVWDPSFFSGFRKNTQNAKRTFEMLKWQKSFIVRCLLLDWNHWMSVHAMNFYFYIWLLKILWPENTSSHISRHLEFNIEQSHRVNWVSGSLDYRVTGSLGHKMWPSSISGIHYSRARWPLTDSGLIQSHNWFSWPTTVYYYFTNCSYMFYCKLCSFCRNALISLLLRSCGMLAFY